MSQKQVSGEKNNQIKTFALIEGYKQKTKNKNIQFETNLRQQ